jgi:NTP pyrophosphatase (non-canonical NTP hydrolase)
MNANNYQEKAMTTKMPSCDNLIYMLGLLHEEAGELQGKFNKAQRKGLIVAEDNQWVWKGTAGELAEFEADCIKELGDVCWAVAGIADTFGYDLADVMQGNLDKLADRHNRGVIDGKGDNR